MPWAVHRRPSSVGGSVGVTCKSHTYTLGTYLRYEVPRDGGGVCRCCTRNFAAATQRPLVYKLWVERVTITHTKYDQI